MERIIELSFNNREDVFILPINPPEMVFTSRQMNQKINLLDTGEINLIGAKGLISTEISSFFPSPTSPFFRRAKKTPAEYVALLKKWKASKRPIRLIITDLNVNLAMAIDSLAFRAVEGNSDVNYTLILSEYRFLNVPEVKDDSTQKLENSTTLSDRPGQRPILQDYVVKENDDLWTVAAKSLGDGSRYREVYQVNKSLIDKENGNESKKYRICTGQKLAMPL